MKTTPKQRAVLNHVMYVLPSKQAPSISWAIDMSNGAHIIWERPTYPRCDCSVPANTRGCVPLRLRPTRIIDIVTPPKCTKTLLQILELFSREAKAGDGDNMDFASLMSAEISKSKQLPSPSTPNESTKKYLKRAEIEAQRQQTYLDEQAAIQLEREAKLTKKRKLDEEEAIRNAEREEKRRRLAEESRRRREEEEAKRERARRKRLGLPELPEKSKEDGEGASTPDGEEDIPEIDLLQKLRCLSEPAILFGESHLQRLHRYRKLTAVKSPQPSQTTGPIPTTLTLVPEAEMKISPTLPKDTNDRAFLFRQLASYFTMILTEWAHALAQRPTSVKESHQGKTAYNAMVQSRDNMVPLFRKFEQGDLEDGILEPVVEIVHAAQEKRYVDANDGYLRLSIGKAAWPIGVTMVGIHERSAREKLHESDKGAAHIMSDEGTRKWLQSIKRCLSFAQTRWPPEDLMQLMG